MSRYRRRVWITFFTIKLRNKLKVSLWYYLTVSSAPSASLLRAWPTTAALSPQPAGPVPRRKVWKCSAVNSYPRPWPGVAAGPPHRSSAAALLLLLLHKLGGEDVPPCCSRSQAPTLTWHRRQLDSNDPGGPSEWQVVGPVRAQRRPR